MVQHIAEVVNAVSRPKMSSPESVWEQAANTASGMDRKVFVDLLNGLWSGMGRVTMPDATTIRVWYLCLHDLTVQQFGRAVQRYLTERSSEFVNVQLIRELSGVQEAKSAAPILAWDTLLRAIKHFGAYETPRFKDPMIPVVIRHLGGWVKVCDTESEELHKWTRQTFEKTYAALAATKPEAAKLTNLIEQENARTGMVEAAAEVQQRIGSNQEQRKALRLISDGI